MVDNDVNIAKIDFMELIFQFYNIENRNYNDIK